MKTIIQSCKKQEPLWLGNADGEDLKKMISGYLSIFDDAMQTAFDQGNESVSREITDCFNVVEAIKKYNCAGTLSDIQRQDLIGTVKHAMKLIIENDLFDFSHCSGCEHGCFRSATCS